MRDHRGTDLDVLGDLLLLRDHEPAELVLALLLRRGVLTTDLVLRGLLGAAILGLVPMNGLEPIQVFLDEPLQLFDVLPVHDVIVRSSKAFGLPVLALLLPRLDISPCVSEQRRCCLAPVIRHLDLLLHHEADVTELKILLFPVPIALVTHLHLRSDVRSSALIYEFLHWFHLYLIMLLPTKKSHKSETVIRMESLSSLSPQLSNSRKWTKTKSWPSRYGTGAGGVVRVLQTREKR